MAAPGKGVSVKTLPQNSLVVKFAARYAVEPEKMLATLRATAFKTGKNDRDVTNEEMVGLLVVADQYQLNPFTREIYAFRDQKGGIVPIVGVDGYIRMMNSHPQFAAQEFKFDEEKQWVESSIWRKDREKPTVVREYLEENYRNTGPWQQMPQRMLRHRALIQSIRIAFGFSGIYDDDEGEAISLAAGVDLLPASPKAGTAAPQAKKSDLPATATDEQLAHIRAELDKSGVPENELLAQFEIGLLEELHFDQVADVLAEIKRLTP